MISMFGFEGMAFLFCVRKQALVIYVCYLLCHGILSVYMF